MKPEDYEERNVGPRQLSRKDTKKWCKGKVGREHTPVVELNTRGYGFLISKGYKCGTPTRMFRDSFCMHHVVCGKCGKHLMYSPEVCPDTGKPTNR